jgi:PBSX family phage terminase large subunit
MVAARRTPATGKVLRHEYAPRGGCKEVFEAREDEVLISGPAGTGKSRACLEKLYTMCLLTPNLRVLILRKTLRSLGSTALVTWRNFVIKEALATGAVVYYGGSSQEAPQYRFRNGSTVTIGGLDNPTRVMSSEYDVVYVQEATEITIEDLEFVKTRLRNWTITFQQLIMDCNPAGDKHWLKLRCNEGKCRLIESRHEDNPRLFDLLPDGSYRVTTKGASYIAILDNLTGVRYKRLRLGLWVSAEGIVYEEFDPAKHVVPWSYDDEGNALPLPAEWERYWAIDFGFSHPFVLKCYAEDPEDGALYMYREIYMTGRTVAEHAQTIMDCVTREKTKTYWDHLNRIERTIVTREWIEPMPTAIICDHDAEDRRTFEKATGLGTQPAIKAVSVGIDLHKQRLKGDAGGPLILYMADALVERDQSQADKLLPTDTVSEYASYVWKVSADGRIQDEPVKRDDDGMDTDRYMTMFKDFKGRARVTLID